MAEENRATARKQTVRLLARFSDGKAHSALRQVPLNLLEPDLRQRPESTKPELAARAKCLFLLVVMGGVEPPTYGL